MRKDDNWLNRYQTMGDIAEAAFEQAADDDQKRWDRYGLNRPKSNMSRWTPNIRYTPDYIQHNRLVEVKGCGRDGLVKIKQENLEALRNWEAFAEMPVWLFCWNSQQEQSAMFELTSRFMRWLGDNCQNDRFPDNNKLYWEIPFTDCQEQPWL